MATVLDKLKHLVNQVDDAGCCSAPCAPVCNPIDFPFLQVCMLEPPCAIVPTVPQYVKPLKLPCPPATATTEVRDPEVDYKTGRSNFYNYYNVDYRKTGIERPCAAPKVKKNLLNCVPITDEKECDENAGCPTGFKPCKMKLCPPPGCHPLGTWKATVQPCPPKCKPRQNNKYYPGECTRPCCLHWKPKDGVCKYDQPCKAHCYDHPPGIKSSGRTC